MNVTQTKFQIKSVWHFYRKYNYLTVPTLETFLNSTGSDFKTGKQDRITFSVGLEDRIRTQRWKDCQSQSLD